MAIGLGGLYLLVRVRPEAGERDPSDEPGAARDEIRPGGADVDPTGWGHMFPHVTNPPAWAKDEQIWERAKQRVRPHWHEYREPWAVVAHVYEQMGGRTA